MIITGSTPLAGVVGRPIAHSLSPRIHNAWLAAAGIEGVYVALAPRLDRFGGLVDGLRGAVFRGLNITVPFKEQALGLADVASVRARRAGAANLLIFDQDGRVQADNTDGAGLLGAFAIQAPAFRSTGGPVAILGAGGAARGAAAAFIDAGTPAVRIINRSTERAEAIAGALGERVSVFDWASAQKAMDGAHALVNATTLGLAGGEPLEIDLTPLPRHAVVMDMVYRPLITPLLAAAADRGHPIVDGLEMLIRQAAPSFEAFFGQPPPANLDVRALVLSALEPNS